MTMEILKVQDLCKTYGKGEAKVEALKKVSLSLDKGEFAAVVGESGSGKSTLLNCIGALDTPTSGHILVDGQDLFSMKEEQRTIFRRRNIGFIFQSFQLVSELNVEQNIIFPLLLDYRKPDPAEVEEILDLLGLTERRHHLPNQLSGGQQQRVAIGRALITKPKLILADEPTGNLDSKNSQDVMALLTQASRRYQQTILMITHNKNLTASVDRVFRVSDLSNEQISSNNNLLGLLGQSRVPFLLQVYLAAAVLFVLVMLAGIMMIASSLNSNVAQRTEFFGLMRCIGATPKQVMRLVRKEALSWCRLAIPVGISIGVVVIWVLCAVLRFLGPEYFEAMPTFGLSIPSILAGIVVGLLTVLLAAYSPAKKAAKVSPLAAVSGNANTLKPARNAANTKLFKIDTALGIHHAKASRKNLLLMTSSFALSIILFLSFSVTVEFMQHTLTPLHPWTADLSIISPDNSCAIDKTFLEDLKENSIVDLAYGRMFAYEVPSVTNGIEKKVDLISYEQHQFDWAKDYLLEGSLESAQNDVGTGLIVYEQQNTIQIGDTVTLNISGQKKEIQIVGTLSDCPFYSAAGVGTIICSEDTFKQITSESKYTIIDVQLTKDATDEDVYAIHQMVDSTFTFSDERMGNSSTMGTYYCFWLFVYGFLVLIALITVFNIINSIAMSVSSRSKQYGSFRAIGLSTGQLRKMIVAEAFTYTIIGGIVGTILGLLSNKVLFEMLISYKWGDTWTIPLKELGIILLIVVLSAIVAVYGPIKRIHNMSIVDTISAQ